MAGRPNPTGGAPQSLRVDILKELQALIDDREVRDRIDRGPLAETKGKEHWVLHLLLKAQELNQARVDSLVGTAYSNLLARLQALDLRLNRIEEQEAHFEGEVTARLDSLQSQTEAKLREGIDRQFEAVGRNLQTDLTTNLDAKWQPVGESIDTFVQASRSLTKDVADTYLVATQVRLLLNENARRMTDLGRDLVALEESLKLVLSRSLEESLQPVEARLSALEAHLSARSPASAGAGRSSKPAVAPPHVSGA